MKKLITVWSVIVGVILIFMSVGIMYSGYISSDTPVTLIGLIQMFGGFAFMFITETLE